MRPLCHPHARPALEVHCKRCQLSNPASPSPKSWLPGYPPPPFSSSSVPPASCPSSTAPSPSSAGSSSPGNTAVGGAQFGDRRLQAIRRFVPGVTKGVGDVGVSERGGDDPGGMGCWFGAMPVCLAGQYRFGGRCGASVLLMAVGKLIVGLAFGKSFVRILGQFPIGILGVMLLFSGVEMAMASRDMGSKEKSFVMLVCAAVSPTGSSTALGFGCGIVLFLVLRLRELKLTSLMLRSTLTEDENANNVAAA